MVGIADMSRHTKLARPNCTDVWIYRDVLIERNRVSGTYTAWCDWPMVADTRNGIRETVREWRENSGGKTIE
jgi:hypothetical protein